MEVALTLWELNREAWVQYDHNAVVEYEGHLYKIVQPHQSEPNWQPPVVPALWSRVPEECHHEYRSGGDHQGNQQQYQNQNQGFVDQSSGGGYGQQNMPQPGELVFNPRTTWDTGHTFHD
jgi:hypothetical protein